MQSICGTCISIMVLLLSLFSGLRSPTSDQDYLNYLIWLNPESSMEEGYTLSSKDPLFQFMGILLRSDEGNLILLMVAISIISLSIKIRVFRSPYYYGLLGLGLLFVISRFFLVHEFTQVRAALAISIATLGLIYSLERKWMLALFIFSLGVFVHLSTIVLAPLLLYAYPARGYRKSLIGGLIAVLLAVFVLSGQYPAEGVDRIFPYFSGQYDTRENSLLSSYFLVKVATVVFLLLQWRHLNHGIRLAVICSSYGIILTVIFLNNDVLSLRFSELTAIFDGICLAYIFIYYSGRYRLIAMGCATFLSAIFYYSASNIVNDYYMIFWYPA
ncbi:MAG: EpsG family protein [Bacteroidota bacterium]